MQYIIYGFRSIFKITDTQKSSTAFARSAPAGRQSRCTAPFRRAHSPPSRLKNVIFALCAVDYNEFIQSRPTIPVPRTACTSERPCRKTGRGLRAVRQSPGGRFAGVCAGCGCPQRKVDPAGRVCRETRRSRARTKRGPRRAVRRRAQAAKRRSRPRACRIRPPVRLRLKRALPR